ncbi:Bcl-2-like protein, partial [Monkeypox virus]
CFID